MEEEKEGSLAEERSESMRDPSMMLGAEDEMWRRQRGHTLWVVDVFAYRLTHPWQKEWPQGTRRMGFVSSEAWENGSMQMAHDCCMESRSVAAADRTRSDMSGLLLCVWWDGRDGWVLSLASIFAAMRAVRASRRSDWESWSSTTSREGEGGEGGEEGEGGEGVGGDEREDRS